MIFNNLIYPEKEKLESEFKYYWRVVIGRRDMKGPLFEIAGFMDKDKADQYINDLRKNEAWDDKLLCASRLMYALPPYVISENDILQKQIEYLKEVDQNG